jgi:hypothetical protein
MAANWIVIIESSEVTVQGLQINAVFTDQVSRKERRGIIVSPTATLADIKRTLKTVADRYEAADAMIAQLKALPTGQIDLTVADDKLPDGEAERLAFFSLWQQWQSAKRKVDAGIVADDDPDVVTLRDAVRKAYQPAFLTFG